MEDESIILNLVREFCKNNPAALSKVIDAATLGVQDFARKQQDFGSKLGFAMSAVLDETTQEKFGQFSRKELFEMTEPWLSGTDWFEKNKEFFTESNVKMDKEYPLSDVLAFIYKFPNSERNQSLINQLSKYSERKIAEKYLDKQKNINS